VRTLIDRARGVRGDERAWRIGADGEEKVAARLAKLPAEWTVLHAIRPSDSTRPISWPNAITSRAWRCDPGS
jgi:hypothetical protein